MLMMFYFIMFILIITLILLFLNMFFMKKSNFMREKIFPIECGFSMMNSLNYPFSIQFYYIAILFLIFDVEISLILPMIQEMNMSIIFNWMISFILIMLILLVGLIYEYKFNMIKWMK